MFSKLEEPVKSCSLKFTAKINTNEEKSKTNKVSLCFYKFKKIMKHNPIKRTRYCRNYQLHSAFEIICLTKQELNL